MQHKQSAAKSRGDSPPPKLIDTTKPPESGYRENHMDSDSGSPELNPNSSNQVVMADTNQIMDANMMDHSPSDDQDNNQERQEPEIGHGTDLDEQLMIAERHDQPDDTQGGSNKVDNQDVNHDMDGEMNELKPSDDVKTDNIATKMQDGAELSRADVLASFGNCEPNLDEFLQLNDFGPLTKHMMNVLFFKSMNEITIADLKMIIYQCLINDQDLPILSEQNTRTFLYRIAQYKGDADECYEEMLSFRRNQ